MVMVAERIRADAWYRALDTKDEVALLQLVDDDVQATDELMCGWVRGRHALEATLLQLFPRVADVHSTIVDHTLRVYDRLEIETFMLRQSYLLDGIEQVIEAPTTIVWHPTPAGWRVALLHSVPLAC